MEHSPDSKVVAMPVRDDISSPETLELP